MPRKKKNPEEMSDREILESVFGKPVVRRIDEELQPYREPREVPMPESELPNNQSL